MTDVVLSTARRLCIALWGRQGNPHPPAVILVAPVGGHAPLLDDGDAARHRRLVGETEQEAGGRTVWDAARPRLDVLSDSEC